MIDDPTPVDVLRTNALRMAVLTAAIDAVRDRSLRALVAALTACGDFPSTVSPPEEWQAHLRASLWAEPPVDAFGKFLRAITEDPLRGVRAAIQQARTSVDVDDEQRECAQRAEEVLPQLATTIEDERLGAITAAVYRTLAAARVVARDDVASTARERVAAVLAAAGAIVPGTLCGRRSIAARAHSPHEPVDPLPLAGTIVRSRGLDDLTDQFARNAVSPGDDAGELTRGVLALAGGAATSYLAPALPTVHTGYERARVPELAARRAVLEAAVVAVCVPDLAPLDAAVERARCYPEALQASGFLYAAGLPHVTIRRSFAWDIRPAFDAIEGVRAAAELAEHSGDDEQRGLAAAVLPKLNVLRASSERREV